MNKIFKKKLKIELPYDPGFALLGIYPKDIKFIQRIQKFKEVHAPQCLE